MKPLTAKEAAKNLGMSYGKFLELAKQKKIPHYKVGRKILCRPEALERWVVSQEVKSLEAPEVEKEYGVLRKVEL